MRRALIAALATILTAPLARGQSATSTASSQALTFFKNYFVTGDYAVAGVGVRGTGVNGIATGNITFTTDPADPNFIPDGVDVLGAFLYWETVQTANSPSGATGATFRGADISTIAKALNPAGTAPCWSSGGATGGSDGAHRLVVYRADVLRFIPIDTSATLPDGTANPNYGKHLIKTSHQVQLPDAGSGNNVPSTAGATLVVIYRDPRLPLKAIVIYDGGYTLDQSSQAMNQTLQGFYQASTVNPSFKMTQVVGNGQENFTEDLRFNGSTIATNPFTGALGPASDPAWDSPTFSPATSPAMSLPPGSASATTAVTHNTATFDCLSWGAIVFSTTVQDTDNDGLLDIWESSATTLYDPNGQPLPNLKAMGADPNVKDIFIEIGYMKAPSGYSIPSPTDAATTIQVPAHSHLPTRAALDLIGDAFKRAPVTNPNGATGIRMHFDVGNNYAGDPYVIPFVHSDGTACTAQPDGSTLDTGCLARGGETAPETACVVDATHPNCQYSAYPGTVGWKSAYMFYRNQPIAYPPVSTATSEEQACTIDGPSCQRRFDRNRKDVFRYAFFAHALGLPRSADPNSPLYHVPKNTSGIADLLGGDIMVTLGFWDNFVGSDFMQASTLMHELGHNLALRHGGVPLEPNCKPNYQSVMNYLFQARGLITTTGKSVLDYSQQGLPGLDPNSLSEPAPFQPSATMLYTTRWYAPFASSFIDTALGTTPATHHCNGTPITDGSQWVRVDGTTTGAPIDWNANGMTDSLHYAQDISFNALTTPSGLFRVLNPGANDWTNIDLRQIGSRRNVGSPRLNGGLSIDVGFGDVGFGDVGLGDVGFGDVGFGDVGFGDVGFGDVGFGDVGFGDVGTGDLGFGDVGVDGGSVGRGEMDLDTATALGNAPDSLTAAVGKGFVTLKWAAPHVGAVSVYSVYRVIGTTVTPANFASRVLVGTTPNTTAVDTTVKNNVTYTYFVTAIFADGTTSGVSNFATILVK